MKGECALGTGNSSAKVLRQEWAFCVPETEKVQCDRIIVGVIGRDGWKEDVGADCIRFGRARGC